MLCAFHFREIAAYFSLSPTNKLLYGVYREDKGEWKSIDGEYMRNKDINWGPGSPNSSWENFAWIFV